MVDLSKLKILLIEDQPDNRALTRNMLMELGINQIFEASDGQEGLSFADFARDMINFVICDWNMPNVSGLKVLRTLREDNPDLPFLMITGRGDIESVTKARDSGVSGYIKKPFSHVQLEAKLRIIIHRRLEMAKKEALKTAFE